MKLTVEAMQHSKFNRGCFCGERITFEEQKEDSSRVNSTFRSLNAEGQTMSADSCSFNTSATQAVQIYLDNLEASCSGDHWITYKVTRDGHGIIDQGRIEGGNN